jgi:hypothetical protein
MTKAGLFLQHPEAGFFRSSGLIHPPTQLSSTAAWMEFRDKTLLPLNRERPEDVNIHNFLNQVKIILAWREHVPHEDRFWRAD